MNVLELQYRLLARGCDLGPDGADGVWGKATRGGVMEALTDGPDTRLRESDFHDSAMRLGVPTPAIKAVAAVEATGAGFIDGRPAILFEGHRFSKATAHRYDATHPAISYPSWDRSKYPRTQEARYGQLMLAVCLDVDAGFASASYGAFQVLGENFAACGYANAFEFAVAMAYDEGAQLRGFESFITRRGLVQHLRTLNWDAFAEGYNGTGYRANFYPQKLAAAYANPRRYD